MPFWTDLRLPAQHDMLVAIIETHWLHQYAEAATLAGVMDIMSGLFALTGARVAEAGGRQIKTLGDNALTVFPSADADHALNALISLRAEANEWLGQRGYTSRIGIKADVGPVALGLIGAPGQEILDVFGRPVAGAFTLQGTGLTVTAPVFRLLSPDTRTLLRKHTPPVTYIGTEDRRPRD